jgi:aspartate/methionine/tyrosine aminotransferase
MNVAGKKWVKDHVATLTENRNYIWDAVSVMPSPLRSSGALYFMVKLPDTITDLEATELLAKKYRVLVVPCSGCGTPGCIHCNSNVPGLWSRYPS